MFFGYVGFEKLGHKLESGANAALWVRKILFRQNDLIFPFAVSFSVRI